MALTYPQDVKSSSDVVRGDYAADQYRGKSRLDALIDLCAMTHQFPTYDNLSGGSETTDGSWQTAETSNIVVPHLVEAALLDILCIDLEANVDGAGESGKFRMTLTGVSDDSNYEVAVTETASTEKTVTSTPVSAGDLDAMSVITWTLEVWVDTAGDTVNWTVYDAAVYWDRD